VVSQATLSLYTFAAWGEGASGSFSVHRVTRDWDPRVANWIGAASGVRWTTEGGDFEPPTIATFSLSGASGQWATMNVRSVVQAFVANPSTNYGLLIQNTDGVRGPFFNASESGNQSRRPKLTITYESSTAVTGRLVPLMPWADRLTGAVAVLGLDGRIAHRLPGAAGVYLESRQWHADNGTNELTICVPSRGAAR